MKRITVRRSFLYAGLFLAVLGGVLVLADMGRVDAAALLDAVRLWPLILIGAGAAIVLRRTAAALPAGLFAAAVPGLVLGSAVAVVPRFGGDCGARTDPVVVARQQGAFDGPAKVSVAAGCGRLTVHPASGAAWSIATGNTQGHVPAITASARSLAIDDWPNRGSTPLDAGRDVWDLALPTTPIELLDLTTFANRATVDLAGTSVGRLEVTANASDVVVDAGGASVGTFAVVLNVGSFALRLPSASDVTGSLRIGGGSLRLCAPDDLGLRITSRGLPREIRVGGVDQDGGTWQNAAYSSAAHRADLNVTANFGTIEINPVGGCS